MTMTTFSCHACACLCEKRNFSRKFFIYFLPMCWLCVIQGIGIGQLVTLCQACFSYPLTHNCNLEFRNRHILQGLGTFFILFSLLRFTAGGKPLHQVMLPMSVLRILYWLWHIILYKISSIKGHFVSQCYDLAHS